ncbi:hypothetical protein OG588_30930 [Streptomyces prunicolor]|uniref:hypothetical protein n=1 Tax=Streptomyces prunicolor TaxID=67348 RepID=UPI00386E0868|nr:hypothetical protein OG588_30930 [Streptomyces prunicolor]
MRRLLMVGFVPCGLFVTCLGALVRAGSFAGRSDWARVIPGNPSGQAGILVALTVCTSLLALLLQPFQVRAVRVLEGYWDRWPATAGLAGVLIEVQRRRWEALRERAEGAVRGDTARRRRADAGRRLKARPDVGVLLPTSLGNALRAGELSAGERYGLSTLASWPRVYMQVSDRMSDTLSAARDALDTSVNLCWSFLAVAVVSGVAVYDEVNLWWLWGGALLLAAVAYKGAVIVAQAYSGLMHVVYDLHRFELLDALHYPLPLDDQAEQEIFGAVSDRFTGQAVGRVSYDHGGGRSHSDDADHRTHSEHVDGEAG